MSRSVKQHYIPQFLLREFADSRKRTIWTYDKRTSKRFAQNSINAAQENSFYDLEIGETNISAEGPLSYLEALWAPKLKRITSDRSLAFLSINERRQFSEFLAIQFVRTRSHRERIRALSASIKEAILRKGWPQSEHIEQQLKEPTEDDLKAMTFHALADVARYAPHFQNKDWFLFESDPLNDFYISDHPIVLHNELDFGWRGNLGIAVKGIQIYMPLSPTLCLALMCPSILQRVENDLIKAEIESRFDPENPRLVKAREDLLNLKSGNPRLMDPENVVFVNSLQVINAHRFIFAARNRFVLVDSMLTENPKFRLGPKPITV